MTFDTALDEYLEEQSEVVARMERDLMAHMQRTGEIMEKNEEQAAVAPYDTGIQVVEWMEHEDGSVTFALNMTQQELRAFAKIGLRQALADACAKEM